MRFDTFGHEAADEISDTLGLSPLVGKAKKCHLTFRRIGKCLDKRPTRRAIWIRLDDVVSPIDYALAASQCDGE